MATFVFIKSIRIPQKSISDPELVVLPIDNHRGDLLVHHDEDGVEGGGGG